MGFLEDESALSATLNQDINYYTMMENQMYDLMKKLYAASNKKIDDAILDFSFAEYLTWIFLNHLLLLQTSIIALHSLSNMTPSIPNINYETAIFYLFFLALELLVNFSAYQFLKVHAAVKNSYFYMVKEQAKDNIRRLIIGEIVGFGVIVFLHVMLAVHLMWAVSLVVEIRKLGPNRPIQAGELIIFLGLNAAFHAVIFCIVVLYNCLAPKRHRRWWPYAGGILYREKIHLLHPSRFDHCQEICRRLLLARNLGNRRELERILYDELEPFTQKFIAALNGTLPAPPIWNFSSLD